MFIDLVFTKLGQMNGFLKEYFLNQGSTDIPKVLIYLSLKNYLP